MNKTFLLGLMLILFAGLTLAVPGVPHHFQGSVTVNGKAAPDGTEVTATVDGITRGEGTTVDGMYGVDSLFEVSDPDGVYGTYHPTIKFYVNGKNTGKTATFVASEDSILDLSVTITSGGSTSSSGGSGGGGGGSLFGSDLWDCEEWSECIDGEQTQECTQGIGKKTNTRECEEEDIIPGTTSLVPPTPPGFEEGGVEEDLLAGPGAPPITGAATAEADEDKSFIGMLSDNWLVPFLIGVVVVLVVLVLVLTGRRGKKVATVSETKPSQPPVTEKPELPKTDEPEPFSEFKPEPATPSSETSSTFESGFDELPDLEPEPEKDRHDFF